MPQYVLTYYNSKGLAEVSRLIMAAAGVDYTDTRITREQWPDVKPSTPMGKLPMLEVDGKVSISESDAIARYLAREHGLEGKTSLDNARVDMLSCAFKDVIAEVPRFMHESDPTKKEMMKQKFFSETMPPFLTTLEKMLKSNNGGTGFFVGDSLTYADIVSFHFLSSLSGLHGSILDGKTTLKEHSKRIGNIPKIKEWIEKRPKTDF